MIIPHKRTTMILYTTAVCNLKCIYCYIDKSPSLVKIDKILDNSFNSDYYFEFSKQIFEKDLLDQIQFWGGEPSIGLHRVYNLLPKFIEYYPNLHEFLMSTNFTPSNWFDEFYGFLEILGRYPERKFQFSLQLSIDGPEKLNDENRGIGVTKSFLEHFDELIETIPNKVPGNVILEVHFKQTYSNKTIEQLQTEEAVCEYFKFFDDLITKFNDSLPYGNIRFIPTIPNTATPGSHTIQDGKNFANYCKITRALDKKQIFKNFNCITSYMPRDYRGSSDFANYHTDCATCGAGIQNMGLLPDWNISLCHGGFTNLLEEYKLNSKNNHINDDDDTTILKALFTYDKETFPMCMPYEYFKKIEKFLLCFYDCENTFQVTNLVALIKILAASGQIEKRFLKEEDAIAAAKYYLTSTAFCIRDNIAVTGSTTMYPYGLLKLLLNGAYEYLVEGKE